MISKILFAISLALSLVGCHGLKPVEVVKHPEAPMLVRESRGQVKVAIYDKSGKKLIDYGWVEVPVGWTLHQFDWEAFLVEENSDD